MTKEQRRREEAFKRMLAGFGASPIEQYWKLWGLFAYAAFASMEAALELSGAPTFSNSDE